MYNFFRIYVAYTLCSFEVGIKFNFAFTQNRQVDLACFEFPYTIGQKLLTAELVQCAAIHKMVVRIHYILPEKVYTQYKLHTELHVTEYCNYKIALTKFD